MSRMIEILHQRANHEAMLDWSFRYDPDTRLWNVWRRDGSPGHVTARKLLLDASCESDPEQPGVMHCTAELLAAGQTCHGSGLTNADQAWLRILVPHDQVVEVPTMEARSKSVKLGG